MRCLRTDESFFYYRRSGGEYTDNLTKNGYPVADAWIDAVEDRLTDDHPMIVAAENRHSISPLTGRADWASTTMSNDHVNGHGSTVANIPNSDIYWLSVKWKEVHLIKQTRVQI